MVKKFWRAEPIIFLGIWLVLMIAGRTGLFRDPGTFWHVVVGQRILRSGHLIRTDPFSFTEAGRPWIARQWLGECAMALVHRMGGLDSLLLATATILAGLYTWVAHRLLRAGIHPLLAGFIVALTMAASSYHFHPRPHLATIVLLGWTFACLCDFEAGRIPLRSLFWLVPVFIVWTNIHDGVVGGMGTVALTVAGWGLAKLMGQPSPLARSRQIIPLGLLVVACILTALVNPYGLAMPRAWFALIGSPVLPKVIDEHVPLLKFSGYGIVLLLALFYGAALIGVWPQRPRITWLIPLVWFYLTWTRVRHGPLFAITAGIALGEILPEARWVRWLARHGSVLFRLRSVDEVTGRNTWSWPAAAVPVGVVAAAVVCQALALPVPVVGRGWVKLDRTRWPVDLLPQLRQAERARPPGAPIFNEMLFGGFLIYYTPGFRVFIDDRCELYGDQGLLAYVHALVDDPAQVDRWAEQYGFDLALVETGSKFDRYLRGAGGWSMVGRSAAATLYRRTAGSRPAGT